MRSLLSSVSLTALLLLVTTSAAAADRVAEFRGSGNSTTAIFRVESPWILDWRLDGDYEQMVAIDVSLVEAKTGKHVGRVLHTKRKGNGVKLFRSGGLYRLKVSSSLARWTLRIEQLTREEAELYTPRN